MFNKIYIKFVLFTFLLSALVIYPRNVLAAEVKIDNFDVVQKNIPKTASKVDFKLTIRQQGQNLDCSNLPFNNGDLDWVVWYETTLTGSKFIVRGRGTYSGTYGPDSRSTNLPLSPNPLNLDFSVSNFVPDNVAIQAGHANFFAAVGCTNDVSYPGRLSTNLAIATAVPVSISSSGGGGGQKYKCNSSNQCVADPSGAYTTSNCDNSCGSSGGDQSYTFNIPNPLKGGAENLSELVGVLALWIFNLAIPIAVAMIVYAGVMFITSRGEPAKITKAKQILLYAVVGLAIILIGRGFITLIKSVLNLGAGS